MLSLPLEVWDIISWHMNSAWYLNTRTTGRYLQLAQVNREFRRYFLSDLAWAQFDVHNVRGSSANLNYIFGNYTLGGVAGHYMNFLTTLEPFRRAWHLNGQILTGHLDWNDLYDHLIRLFTIDELSMLKFGRHCWKCEHEATHVPQSVWELVLSHCPDRSWRIGSESYKHLLGVKPICLALLRCVSPPSTSTPDDLLTKYGYQDDWDINMALFNRGMSWKCAAHFQNNEKFLLEALRSTWLHFGCVDLYLKPSFLNKILAQNPGLLDFVAWNFPGFHRELEDRRNVDSFGCTSLEELPVVMQNHDRYVLVTVARTGSQLQYASKRLRDSEHVVAAAILECPSAFQYASARLRDNKELVLWAVKKWPDDFPSFSLKTEPPHFGRRGRHNLESFISPRLKRELEQDPDNLQVAYESVVNRDYPDQPFRFAQPEVWKEYLDQALVTLPYKAKA